jgi:hypothetical protein
MNATESFGLDLLVDTKLRYQSRRTGHCGTHHFETKPWEYVSLIAALMSLLLTSI